MDDASPSQTPSTIADQARQVAAGGGEEAAEALRASLRRASPDERSAVATELVAEAPAYDVFHAVLRELEIAPPEGTANEAT